MTLPNIIYSRLQVLLTERTRYSTKLIDQYSFGMQSIGCPSRHLLLKLLLIYGSVFVSSLSSSSSSSSSSYSLLFGFSLRLPPSVHINFPWGNLSPLPPCLLPCVKPEARLIHNTLLGTVLIWYSINRLLQPALATQAASILRLCLRLPFLFFLFFFSFFSLLLLSRAST